MNEAHATIDGQPVVDYRLTMPRVGVWVCEASLSAGDQRQPQGAVELQVGASLLKGTVELAATAFGTTVLRVRGGGGGFGRAATAKHYNNATARLVIEALLETASERLASSADSSLLSTSLSQWTVLGLTVGRQVSQLVEKLGSDVSWRVLPAGTVWVGRETWPTVTPEHELLQVNPLAGSFTVSSVDELVYPGETFLGAKVSAAEHCSLDGRIRSILWTE